MKVLERIKDLRGNVSLYDISEYRGITYLYFKADLPPYELTYLMEKVPNCSDGTEHKKLMSIYEISIDENEKPIKGHCGFYIED